MGSNLLDAIAVATAYMFLFVAVVTMHITALRSLQSWSCCFYLSPKLIVGMLPSCIISSNFFANTCKPFLKGEGHTKSWLRLLVSPLLMKLVHYVSLHNYILPPSSHTVIDLNFSRMSRRFLLKQLSEFNTRHLMVVHKKTDCFSVL